ncbi:MAG TPA: hypothetical protein ENJ53_03790 [Phaeodactylibacter sp.]|nr:hypothetical protein [Phaeodactylibacter sp.]
MLRKILLSTVVFLLLSASLWAQKDNVFSEDRGAFIKELKVFFTKSKSKDMESFFKDFEKYFSGSITEEEFPLLREACNEMLVKKMSANPYFKKYLSVVLAIKQNESDGANLNEWNDITIDMLKSIKNRKLKPFKYFLEFSDSFFGKKALRYSKQGVKWYYDSDKYKMDIEEGVPYVEFEKLDLIGVRGKDSILILETKGQYYPTQLKWKGEGGKVTWKKLGQPDVYCLLQDYEVQTKKSLYKAKNVKLVYPHLFPNKEIEGDFEDKVMVRNKSREGSYPRFISYDDVLKIDNIGDGVEYTGGFRLEGNTVYGFGNKENPAKVVVKKAGKTSFIGTAHLFKIHKSEKITGQQVRVVMYFEQDSIYHPSVNLKYDVETKALSLSRGKRGSDRNPFFDSFHQVNINADKVDWNLVNDSLLIGKKQFGIGNGKNEVTFESLKYYDEKYILRIQNISDVNPIVTMKVLAEELDRRDIEARAYALKLNPKFDTPTIERLLYELVSNGFIDYDKDNEMIYVKDKIFHYADAMAKKTDYDAIKLVSTSDKEANAVFSMKDRSLTANDVSHLEISNTQKVAIKPANKSITLKKNRDMDFDGRVYAGFSTLEGKDFHFDYEKYMITMDSVRYFDLFVPTPAKDERGKTVSISIASRIEHTHGVLLVDAPDNKSGANDIDIFPSFNTKGYSYVYYDNRSIHDGVYTRDSFYFKLDKFSFNSLDDFSKDDIHFKGNLVSAGVFPDIKETLLLQEEDQSLGFTTQTPSQGYPTYRKKGNFKGEIHMSNKGMLGKGTISYLTSSTDSEDIIFKPKQMTATARLFDLREDRRGAVEVPQAHGEDISINWRPYRDSMYITTTEKAFQLFKKNDHSITGSLILTPEGLRGNGNMKWTKGSLSSNLIKFGAFSAKSDTSRLTINAVGAGALALDTKNVNSNLDFDKQMGHVEANEKGHFTALPYNQYKTSLTTFDWDMKNDAVTFKTNPGETGSFVATNKNRDSLYFQGETAFYDLKSNELKIGGVPEIKTCDAIVFLDDGKVELFEAGKMSTLENCKIVCDTITKQHVINRATVDIVGKKEYTAKGFYEYNIKGRKQEIQFDNIKGGRYGKGKRSEKKTRTTAKGEVLESDNFYIDLKTEFRGEITLKGDKKELDFKGFARLDSKKLTKREWFSINSEGDKNDLVIAYDVPRNFDGYKLYTGLYLSKSSAYLYPRIMQPKFLRKDRAIMEAKGLFKLDEDKDEFVFGDSLKVMTDYKKGNKITFDNKKGEFRAEGKLNIGDQLKYIKIDAAGEARTLYPSPQDTTVQGPYGYKVEADMMAGIKSFIPKKMLDFIIQDIKSSSFDARGVDFTDGEFYEKALSEYISDSKLLHNTITRMKTEYRLGVPKKHNPYSFLFGKMNMKWDPDYQSFVSTQDQIGLISVNGEEVNVTIKAFIEFKMPSNGDDRMYIYIKSPSDSYYFFGYKGGILNVVSNNTKFNDLVLNAKKKERIFKMDDGEVVEMQYVEPSTAERFVRRVQAARK